MPIFKAFVVANTKKPRSRATNKSFGREDSLVNRFLSYVSIVRREKSEQDRDRKTKKESAKETLKRQERVRNGQEISDWCEEVFSGDVVEDEDMREQRRQDILAAFEAFNIDEGCAVNARELRKILCWLGHNPTEEQVNRLMLKVDLDGNGLLDLLELMRLMDSYFKFSANDPTGDLYPVYRVLAKKSNGGKVKVADVRRLLGTKWTEEDIEEIFDGLKDEDLLDFDQFLVMITGQK